MVTIRNLDDRANLVLLRNEIEAALKRIAAEHDLQITLGHCTYAPTNCSFKLEIATRDDSGITNTRERTEYIRWAPVYQLESEWIDKEVTISAVKYRIAGLNSKKRKSPVLVENLTNHKLYFVSATAIRFGMLGTK